MLRLFTPVLVLICLALPALADPAPHAAPRPLASALEAMQAGRWDVANNLAARDGPAAAELIEWYRLRAGLGTPDEVLAFLRDNGHWPGLAYLRRQNEEVMTHASFDDVLAFYADDGPQTGIGALNHARALTARGQQGEAEASIVLAWRTLDLSTAEHDAFIDAHAKLLAPHHAARLDMALWRGLRDVGQMLPLVTKAQRALAETRQKIKSGARGPDAMIARLPKPLQNDPGLAHALFGRHIDRGDSDRAIALILNRSRIAGGLGEPQRWSGWRRYLARAQMREGNPQIAYQLAAIHQLSEGSDYADLEWLSGYLALTYLNEPALALDHFQRFRSTVETPISLGRAGYWIGRAQEALGDPEGAQIAYTEGARHQTSFYGLLAAERAGLPVDPALSGTEGFPPWQNARFVGSDLHQIGLLALKLGRLTLAEQFFVQLSQSQDRTGLGQMGAMLEDLDQPHLQVMLGKAAARRGIVLHAAYYPLHPMTGQKLPAPRELALAIARRESEFDPSVVSGAGAQGLMQVMPGTARDVARDLGVAYERRKVLSDWRYNTLLGTAYLAQLAQRFDDNVVMVAAGYNAGPGRPLSWMSALGDPRQTGSIDVIDWIEHIPFRETRNYVMRVAESLPIYRARLGLPPHPVPFSRELTGATLGDSTALSD